MDTSNALVKEEIEVKCECDLETKSEKSPSSEKRRRKDRQKRKDSLPPADDAEEGCKRSKNRSSAVIDCVKQEKRSMDCCSFSVKQENTNTIQFNKTNENDGSEEPNSQEKEDKLTKRLKEEKTRQSLSQGLEHNPLHSNWSFSRSEIEALRKKGIKVKKGNWSKQEVFTLKQNMDNYLKAYGLTDPTSLIYRDDESGTEHGQLAKQTQFYQYLAKGLDRPLFHVYRRVLRVYDPANYAGRWTECETDDLVRYHNMYGNQWVKIGKLLGRSGAAVNRKFLMLNKTPGYNYWTQEEDDALNGAVRAVTRTDFDSQITGDIDWTAVSHFVGSRTPDQCRAKWLREGCWFDARGDKIIKWNDLDDVCLIERLYVCDETDENDIDWVKLTKEFPNSPSRQWLITRWSTLKKVVPNSTECDFEEIIDYLHNVHRPYLQERNCPESVDTVSVTY